MTLVIICESGIREIYTSLAIQCMQACARWCYKAINIDFKRNNTPFVLSISQRSSEGRIGPLAKFAVPAWLTVAPASNIISHTLFQLSMNRVLCNRLLSETQLLVLFKDAMFLHVSLSFSFYKILENH